MLPKYGFPFTVGVPHEQTVRFPPFTSQYVGSVISTGIPVQHDVIVTEFQLFNWSSANCLHAHTVGDGVGVGVGDGAPGTGDCDGVRLGVADGVLLGVRELVGVNDGVLLGVTDAVLEGVMDGVTEGVAVIDGVGVGDGVGQVNTALQLAQSVNLLLPNVTNGKPAK